MQLQDLHAALSRLLNDPRVNPTTDVNVEARYDDGVEPITLNESVACVAVSSANGSRSISLSALPRRDAFAR